VRVGRVADEEEQLVERRVRVEDVLERDEAEHRDELFAVGRVSGTVGMGRGGTDTMMTTATAAMKPWRSARESTTSMNPSLKNPSRNENSPAYITVHQPTYSLSLFRSDAPGA
jgi:hypothetical protein